MLPAFIGLTHINEVLIYVLNLQQKASDLENPVQSLPSCTLSLECSP